MKRGFASYHPITNLVFFIGAFTLVLVSFHPYILLASFLVFAFYDTVIKGIKVLKSIVVFILPLIAAVTVINALFNHRGVTVLFTLPGGNSFTLESLMLGFLTALKAADVIILLSVFNAVFDEDKFIYVFGRISPKLALVISMALRFIPLLRRRSEEISRARAGLGIKNEKTSEKIKNALRNASILITASLEKAVDTSLSMKARYYGQGKRSFYVKYDFTPADFAIISSLTAAGLLYAFCIVKGFCSAAFVPVMRYEKTGIALFAALIVWVIFALIPVYTELKAKRRRIKHND